MRPLHIMMFPAGSTGDVLPMLALARSLTGRGHAVTTVTNGHFRDLYERQGLGFVELSSDAEYRELMRHRALWRADIRSVACIVRAAQTFMRRQYELVAGRHPPLDLIVTGPLAFGPRIAGEHLRLPVATVQLAPGVLRSVVAPPALAGVYMPPWLPLWLRGVEWRVLDAITDRLFGELLAFRAELGLPRVRGVFSSWVNSPQLTLGLWPEWFSGHPCDRPGSLVLTGFPMYDAGDALPLTADAAAFLDETAAAGGPLVFTPGTAHAQAGGWLRAAVDACVRLGRPGMLLTPYREQVPADLPPGVRHFDRAPFSQVFARAAAVVHHGGIGTVAQALAAGTRQLITPFAFDQLDNGARVQRLGAGRVWRGRRPAGRALAPALAGLLSDTGLGRGAARCAARFAGVDPVGSACALLEALAQRRR
ncbi:MAG: glycosyltransferase family 1 protein [Gammaproteobacteria bacterium]|nr:glycosyltransferase family 1 protein [Gammaproteobacteria bacterium]